MRNRISHGYFFINLELVWTVAVEDISKLRQQIATVLGKMQAGS
jgi:uncharacterized protein with HEPN domain